MSLPSIVFSIKLTDFGGTMICVHERKSTLIPTNFGRDSKFKEYNLTTMTLSKIKLQNVLDWAELGSSAAAVAAEGGLCYKWLCFGLLFL